MGGSPVGLEMGEALAAARLFGAADALLTTELLVDIEIGALAGVAKKTPPTEGQD